ncbi:hypothetical protein WJ28_09290 [Burkholderia thailandensis]|nr:hypothetical protein WJ27_25210 [Burkholderia thailandensis]KVG17868.1 hypothetical protein WJ28_09290 [Burkholderia thailandensis]
MVVLLYICKVYPVFCLSFHRLVMRTPTFHAFLAHRMCGSRAAVVAAATRPLLRSPLAAPLAAARRLI